ncbi:F-box/LRR-repeat protein At3g26922 [Brassica rapa]|nr:F-box/LRR-repeat protein At3g26922 [Brassica rapa]XP_033138198.1 F-box/LRR-repeat protein At3g26922 [Brassica rapa]XP_033138199.1 F-box/LRR-repeat protein At3g26922 [Brassica rapa]
MDKISHLPEALLLQILSFLPTKDVVATSVLAKRWKHIWKMVPKLHFDYHLNQSQHEMFSENVCRLLLSHKSSVLESLSLRFILDSCDGMDIGMWIGIAYARHVRELILDVETETRYSNFKFPKCFYNCQTLETLIIKTWILIDIPSSQVCLKSLKKLHLCYVDYKDDESVVNLLSGCPNLQELVIHRNLQVVRVFTIAVPSLQRLEIYDWSYGHEMVGSYVVNTPSLKYLKIKGFPRLRFSMVEIAPELVEANVIDLSEVIDKKLMQSLASVKRLSLSLSPSEMITFPNTDLYLSPSELIAFPSTGTIFHQLVHLELSTDKAYWWNLLTRMINTSPRLQVLKLIGEWYYGKVGVSCKEWNQPKNVPECLETFVWNTYKEQQEEEKEVAKYILRNANRLKKASISIKGFNSDERLQLLKELENVVKASNSPCELLMC